MNVSNVTSSASFPSISGESCQRDKELKALQNDLQSGNMKAAQQDYAALQQALQGSASGGAGSQAAGGVQGGKDCLALQSALQSGNISSATQALVALRKDLTTPAQGSAQGHNHSHHHHHRAGAAASNGAPGSQAAAPRSPAVAGLVGA